MFSCSSIFGFRTLNFSLGLASLPTLIPNPKRGPLASIQFLYDPIYKFQVTKSGRSSRYQITNHLSQITSNYLLPNSHKTHASSRFQIPQFSNFQINSFSNHTYFLLLPSYYLLLTSYFLLLKPVNLTTLLISP